MKPVNSLTHLLSKHAHFQVSTGRSDAETYYLPGLAAYLKIAPVESLSNLPREKEVLEWLDGKLAVPKVLGFEESGDKCYILLTAIEGMPGSEYIAANRTDTRLVREFITMSARAMRAIHDPPIHDCPLSQQIDVKLASADENIRRGFVDESDFDKENLGRTAQDIYSELVERNRLTKTSYLLTATYACRTI